VCPFVQSLSGADFCSKVLVETAAWVQLLCRSCFDSTIFFSVIRSARDTLLTLQGQIGPQSQRRAIRVSDMFRSFFMFRICKAQAD